MYKPQPTLIPNLFEGTVLEIQSFKLLSAVLEQVE
jgi:hypothetical protein